MNFAATSHCTSRVHCQTCRTNAEWRSKIGAPEICPVTGNADAPAKGIGLGDVVGAVFTPIARIFKLDCIDPATEQLKPQSPCQKKKDRLNKIRFGG